VSRRVVLKLEGASRPVSHGAPLEYLLFLVDPGLARGSQVRHVVGQAGWHVGLEACFGSAVPSRVNAAGMIAATLRGRRQGRGKEQTKHYGETNA
jgi:hypothetical protein